MSKDYYWVPDVSRNTILKAAREYLDRAKQFDLDSKYGPHPACEAWECAKALIELLEGEDCGSYGGYGKRIGIDGEVEKQDELPSYGCLENRYRWLAEMSSTKSPARARLGS